MVKALDLRSNGIISAWVRTPLVLNKILPPSTCTPIKTNVCVPCNLENKYHSRNYTRAERSDEDEDETCIISLEITSGSVRSDEDVHVPYFP